MATKIQVRRDSAANWAASNPVLDSGEIGYETGTGKVKIGDGSTAWNSLGYFSDSTTFIAKSIVDAKGDLIVGTASDTVARLIVGTNDLPLIADSTAAGGMKWASLPQASVTNLTTDLAGKLTTPGAWTAYTPSWTNLTLGNGTVTARYSQVGKIVTVNLELTWGSTTSASGNYYPSLPVSAHASSKAVGSGFALDNSTPTWAPVVYAQAYNYWVSTSGRVNATTPWAWAVGDIINFTLTYEAA